MELQKWFKTVIGLVVNVLGDMANGIIIVVLVGKVLNIEVPWYFYLPAALPFIGFSCLPDIDFIFTILGGKRIEEHKAIPHLPVLVIPTVCGITCLVCFLVGANILFWFLVSFFGLLFHYFKDSIGRDVSFGVKWLWPIGQFKNRPMKFFTKEQGRRHLVYVFFEEVRGPKYDVHEEVRKYYWGITRELVINIGVFFVAIVLAVVLAVF